MHRDVEAIKPQKRLAISRERFAPVRDGGKGRRAVQRLMDVIRRVAQLHSHGLLQHTRTRLPFARSA